MRVDVSTPDGRTLAVEEAGAPGGPAVIVHLGTPNSRLLYPPNVELAERQGIRLISYDRPGYGDSTPQPGHAVADCVVDVRAICAARGIERAVTWGVSGGGPRALACAALLGDLVVAAASLAGPAPMDAEGLHYFAGMGEENVADIELLLADPEASRVKTERDREELLAASPAELGDAMRTLLTPTDAAVLDGELADYLARSARAGLAPGAEGWWEDSRALSEPWGFDLDAIGVPVLIMHGREDRFVPFEHGVWLSRHVPGAQARLLESDGHLTLLSERIGEVHEWLLERLG